MVYRAVAGYQRECQVLDSLSDACRDWRDCDAGASVVATTGARILGNDRVDHSIIPDPFRDKTGRPSSAAGMGWGASVLGLIGFLTWFWFASTLSYSRPVTSRGHKEVPNSSSDTPAPTPAERKPIQKPQASGSSEPHREPPTKRGPESSAGTSTSTGPITVQPGGAVSIGQQGGQTAGTIINNGAPPPVLSWRTEEASAKDKAVIHFTVDRAVDVPSFLALCNTTCGTSDVTIFGMQQVATHDSLDPQAPVTWIDFTIPRPLGAGLDVTWRVKAVSAEDTLVIKDVRLLSDTRSVSIKR
jgi:hypothetical protein